MPLPDPRKHPLSIFFLSEYLNKVADEVNFHSGPGDAVFDRYEVVFGKALEVLQLTKESLRAKSEFNFDSGDSSKLEAGIATLRVVNALQLMGNNEDHFDQATEERRGCGHCQRESREEDLLRGEGSYETEHGREWKIL